MKSIKMESIIEIYPEAFSFCSQLRHIESGAVKVIGTRAFENCNLLESVVIPATVHTIKAGAFIRCINLREAYFEGNPCTLSDGIFDESITIFGPPGGSIEAYAHQNGYTFKSWKQ